MLLYLDTYINDKGKETRTSMKVGTITEEEARLLPKPIIYENGKDDEDPECEKVMCFYHVRPEKHELILAGKNPDSKIRTSKAVGES